MTSLAPPSATPAPSTAPAAGAVDPEKLKAAAKQFEAVFARQLIGSMRAGKLGDDMFQSQGGDTFRDMADARIADDMAGKGTFGIAELLMKQYGVAKAATPAPAKPGVPAMGTPTTPALQMVKP